MTHRALSPDLPRYDIEIVKLENDAIFQFCQVAHYRIYFLHKGAEMTASELSDGEFLQFQTLLYDITGISLAPSKKALIVSRLSKRLREYELHSFSEYLQLIAQDEHKREFQMAIDLLTTNETYFFREPKHFQFLRQVAEEFKSSGGESFRVWSAACSSGQEPYSIAMVLEDCLGSRQWDIMASDISTKVLANASKGLYPIEQAEQIPKQFLTKFCLKGVGAMAGQFLLEQRVRQKIQFFHGNLNTDLPKIGVFDVIFLRNVMIYFDVETKRQVVKRIQALLKPGGYLLIGHSESLQGVNEELKMIVPSVFKRVQR